MLFAFSPLTLGQFLSSIELYLDFTKGWPITFIVNGAQTVTAHSCSIAPVFHVMQKQVSVHWAVHCLMVHKCRKHTKETISFPWNSCTYCMFKFSMFPRSDEYSMYDL